MSVIKKIIATTKKFFELAQESEEEIILGAEAWVKIPIQEKGDENGV